jgi:hypothetical protein
MRPFYTAATNLVHGLFTMLALLVLVDVASPTFNVEGMPVWTGSQGLLVLAIVSIVALALGIVMHTVSRSVFHNQKQAWTLMVLSSGAVRNRLAALGNVQPAPGGPTYEARHSV